MSVVLAGGGTAGHIEPALALADALRRADPQVSIVCLGTERGLETRLVPLRGYDLALIPPVPLPRQLTPQLLSVPGRLGAAVSAAARVLAQARADVLVGFGGYVATPAYLAARHWVHGPALVAVAASLALSLALASYHVVEKPFLLLGCAYDDGVFRPQAARPRTAHDHTGQTHTNR